MLRAAAIGGGAYAVGKRRQQAQDAEAGQEQRIEELEAQPQQQQPASGGPTSDQIERLKQLGELHEQGVLSDQEFNEQKAKLLGD